jgi:uncharacterized heparinase superfamily protein
VSGTATRIVCVTEHEHRSRAIADDVLRGRFTVAGETRAMGVHPDWLTASLPDDEEWWIEWVKFGWGLDLAHAAEETGDPRYRAAWERLTRAHAEQVAPDADAAEVTARRILNWIYAGERFGRLDHLRPTLDEQVAHVRANLAPERNHRTLELYALAMVGFAFEDAELLAFAIAELDRNLAEDFLPDGVHRECSTHYHMIALRSFAGLRENARRHGSRCPTGSTSACGARASSPCTAGGPTARSRRSRTPTPATTASCSSYSARSPAANARRASPTAATSPSAAAGRRTRAF